MDYIRVPVDFEHEGKHYKGYLYSTDNHVPPRLYGVSMNGMFYAYLQFKHGTWQFSHPEIPGDISDLLGAYVEAWYQ